MKLIKHYLTVFIFFVLSRLPSLGYDLFNTDAWKWKQRIYDFGTGVFYFDFPKTIQKYHPGVTLMWVGTAVVKFYNLGYRLVTGSNPPDNQVEIVFQLHFFQKLGVVLVIAVTLVFIFYALKKLFGLSYAYFVVLLISIEPFYVALTRVLHLEGMMSTFMIASFVWLFYHLKKDLRGISLYVSSVFAALAVLTKTSSLFIVPFAALLIFASEVRIRPSLSNAFKRSFLTFISWLGVGIIFFVILWPAMWAMPREAISTLFRGVSVIGFERGHLQLFMGEWMNDPGLKFYPAVFLYRSSLYLLASLAGILFVFKDRLNSLEKEFIAFTLIFAVLYIVELSIPSKKLDRYILPSLVSLLLVSGFFYNVILSSRKFLMGILILIPSVYVLYLHHPDYLSYYNPVTGGLEKGIYAIEPKWMIGQRELVGFIGKVGVGEEEVIAFPEKYYTQIYPFIESIGGRAVIESVSKDSAEAGLFVYPVWDDYSSQDNRYDLEYIGTSDLRGVKMYNVYRKEN